MSSVKGFGNSLSKVTSAFDQQVSEELDVKRTEKKRLELEAKAQGSERPSAWLDSMRARSTDEQQMLKSLDDVEPVKTGDLRTVTTEVSRLSAVSESFDKLLRGLGGVRDWSEPTVTPAAARGQYELRAELLDRLDKVVTALEAMLPYEARPRGGADAPVSKRVAALAKAIDVSGQRGLVASFPSAQLAELAKKLESEAVMVEQKAVAGDPGVRPHFDAAVLKTAETSAGAIGERLGAPELGAALLGALKGAGKDRAAMETNIVAMARLVGSATGAPDYASLGKGWFHPSSRVEYRNGQHDLFSRFGSSERQSESVAAFKASITAALGAEAPAKALEQALVDRFMAEIGVPDPKARGIQPKGEAIRAALERDMLLPLRALNETKSSMIRGIQAYPDPGRLPDVERAVAGVTKHVAEGDFREWRYENSAHQLQGLSAAQKNEWMETVRSDYTLWDGRKIATREEDGLELAWVTKIGGPSHGFDYGGECLLPLITNGRSKAIMVDDPAWGHNAAARSYIRVLHQPDGSPLLYLEPVQREFPLKKRRDPDMDDGLHEAILKHAITKAEQMGMELSIHPNYGAAVRKAGVNAKEIDQRILVKASNGVYEASDTLGLGHEFDNRQDKLTPALRRYAYQPAAAQD